MSNINPNPFTTRPEIDGTFGVVTSTHWIATAVGMSTLEKGGNAFDAACATAFTLQVVEPHLNGPGGDVPVILFDVRKGRPEVVCGQGPAPAAATIAHYRSLGLDMMPGTGLLAACVPGMFDTWMTLLRDYGTMRLADVLAPAIFYAGEGHPLVERANATIATVEKLFREHWPTSAAVYLRDGKVPATGTLFTNPAIADTYTRVLREAAGPGSREQEIERARKVWSQGFVAEAIDRFCRSQEIMDTSGKRNRGVLTGQDMARWQATIELPLTYQYGRYTVCKPGPWAQGPVMLQQLALLKGFRLDGLDVTGAEFIHTVVEASKLAFADREKFYGDPEFEQIPIETLLSDAYNDERRKLIHHTASLELRPGSVDGFGAVVKLKQPPLYPPPLAGEGREGESPRRCPRLHRHRRCRREGHDPRRKARRGSAVFGAVPAMSRGLRTRCDRDIDRRARTCPDEIDSQFFPDCVGPELLIKAAQAGHGDVAEPHDDVALENTGGFSRTRWIERDHHGAAPCFGSIGGGDVDALQSDPDIAAGDVALVPDGRHDAGDGRGRNREHAPSRPKHRDTDQVATGTDQRATFCDCRQADID